MTNVWTEFVSGAENNDVWERVREVVKSWLAAEGGTAEAATFAMDLDAFLAYALNDPERRLGNVVMSLVRLAGYLAISSGADEEQARALAPGRVDLVVDTILHGG